MSRGPDWSDSEDSLFEDDGGYEDFKVKIKQYNDKHFEPSQLTEEQKRQQDLNAFYSALFHGNVESVTEFLDKGFEANLDVRDGWTPLLLSASYGDPNLTKLLLENGADVNQKRDGMTPLMTACSCPDYTSPFEQSLEVIKLLVENGADVKAVNRKRMDSLMQAACVGNILAVEYLLPKSDDKAVDNQRWNALTWAISCNQKEIVEYLMSKGLDSNLTDIRGNTPLNIAKENGLEDIVNLFPKKELDVIADIVAEHTLDFEDHFVNLKKGQKPRFFADVCNILTAIKCRHLIPLFLQKNVSFLQLLSMNNDDLKNIGVTLPYQRRRILVGIHRFHQRPFHPKSVHICINKDTYSNIDVATQVMSAIQQIMAMEASLKFIQKTWKKSDLTKEQRGIAVKSLYNIKSKTENCKAVVRKLQQKFEEWDNRVDPPDLITKNSITSKIPWKKITFCLSVFGIIVYCNLRK